MVPNAQDLKTEGVHIFLKPKVNDGLEIDKPFPCTSFCGPQNVLGRTQHLQVLPNTYTIK